MVNADWAALDRFGPAGKLWRPRHVGRRRAVGADGQDRSVGAFSRRKAAES